MLLILMSFDRLLFLFAIYWSYLLSVVVVVVIEYCFTSRQWPMLAIKTDDSKKQVTWMEHFMMIRTVYYIHGPVRAKRNFCCFICVSYGPYTLLKNDSFLHL